MSQTSINVIVPAHNAELFVKDCIDGLLEAGFDRHAIIVVDDASEDRTLEVLRECGIEPLANTFNRGAAASRNAGAAASDAKILLFVDADVVVHHDVRVHLTQCMENDPSLAAVFGSYDADPTDPAAISRLRNLLHHHVHHENGGLSTSFWTGLGAIRRDVFDEVGGFDEKIAMMEDIELGMRLHLSGHRVMLDPQLQGKHLKKWTFRSMVRADLWHRAVPWTRLMQSAHGRNVPQGLNISPAGKWSVVAVASSIAFTLAALVAGPAALFGTFVSLVVLSCANRSFLSFVHKKDGALQTVRALGVLWIHFLCGGLGYTFVKLGLA